MALKSLPSGTLLNVAGFSANVKPLFPSSRLCSNVSATRQSTPCSPLSPLPAPWLGVRAGGPGVRCDARSPCAQETLRRTCEHLGGLRADAGGTNLLAALGWALAQPLHHGYPRQLFLFTDAAAGNASRILRLVRRQASTVRYGSGTAAGSRCSPCALGCSHRFLGVDAVLSDVV